MYGMSWVPLNAYLTSHPYWASLVVQRLKCLPAMRETWVRSLGWEDPLEEEMATHSSILAWRIPWVEEPGGLQSTGSQRVRHHCMISLSLSIYGYNKKTIPFSPQFYLKWLRW